MIHKSTEILNEKEDIIPILIDTLRVDSDELTWKELDTLVTDIRRLSPEMDKIYTDILWNLGRGDLDLSFLDDKEQNAFLNRDLED